MTLHELKENWPILGTVRIEHGPGWYSLIDSVMAAIYRAGFDENRDEIQQIKEKFGTLRFYFVCDVSSLISGDCERFQRDDRFERILKAIKENDTSGKTCEVCGQAGRLLVSAGWWSTRCAEHAPQGAVPAAEYFALRELKNRNSGKDQ